MKNFTTYITLSLISLSLAHIAPSQEVLTRAFSTLPYKIHNVVTREKLIDQISLVQGGGFGCGYSSTGWGCGGGFEEPGVTYCDWNVEEKICEPPVKTTNCPWSADGWGVQVSPPPGYVGCDGKTFTNDKEIYEYEYEYCLMQYDFTDFSAVTNYAWQGLYKPDNISNKLGSFLCAQNEKGWHCQGIKRNDKQDCNWKVFPNGSIKYKCQPTNNATIIDALSNLLFI